MKIVIIGGGASGLTAAIAAARNKAAVTVLECGNKPAKKLYATGNGRCNLTNTDMSTAYYRGAEIKLAEQTIERFGYQDTLNFFHELGLMFKFKNGYVYPSTGQAATVAKVLIRGCEELGVKIKCSAKAVSIDKKNNKFIIKYIFQEGADKREMEETADRLILAAGSSAGGFGCDVEGTALAALLGHSIVPVVPALTALRCENKRFFKAAAGVRVEARVALCEEKNGQVICEDTGELQLTEYGISGIPVFQVSRYAGYALLQGKKISALIEYLPEYDFQTLFKAVRQSRRVYGSRSILEVLSFIFHAKLAGGVLLAAGVDENKKISELKDKELKEILYFFKRFCVGITGINGIKDSQVCAGGVSTVELTQDFMSKKVRNLYITGETIDIDGICGGYNLQFAWASGYIAGTAASLEENSCRISV